MFHYCITYIDREASEVKKTGGIVAATNMALALKKITEFFGEDNVVEINNLYELEGILEAADIEEICKNWTF